jgi:predicted nucleic acid-binding protein
VTDVKIVDASALAALAFGEPEAEAIAERLKGATLFAPAFLSFELANVCIIKAQRYPDRRELIKDAFHLAARLEIRMVEVDCDKALELAEATGLTPADACYLYLSRELGGELVTLDPRLAAAAP